MFNDPEHRHEPQTLVEKFDETQWIIVSIGLDWGRQKNGGSEPEVSQPFDCTIPGPLGVP